MQEERNSRHLERLTSVSSLRFCLQFLWTRILPVFLAVLALFGLYWFSKSLEPASYDLLMRITAKPAQESPVVMVLMDDESIKRLEGRFGPLLWRPRAYQEIFQQIESHEPAVIVFDTDTHDVKRIMDKTLQPFPNLVSGWDLAGLKSVPMEDYPWLFSLKAGVVNNDGDESDGVIRASKRFIKTPAGVFPSLSVATAIEYLRVKRGEKHHRFQGQVSPYQQFVPPETEGDSAANASGSMWENSFPEGLLQRKDFMIRWYQTYHSRDGQYLQSHPSIPLWMVFEPDQMPKDFLKGKIVMLGTSSGLYRDHRKSSMGRRHLYADVHATAIDNILFSETLQPAPPWQQFLIMLGFSLFVCLLRIRIRSLNLTVICTAALMLVYLLIAFDQFSQNGWVLDVVTPEIFMMVGLFLGTIFRNMLDDQHVRAMECTVSQLVSQSVFQEIQRSGYALTPGGQKMEITSLFVDIRNFSALAENMPPAGVTELLNEFYTVVEKITFYHRGTVDKFMGDGILIMFGAPIPTNNHADIAYSAAKDILHATEELSRRWWETTGIWVEMGISLTSGPAFVGFLGPIYKLEYTAIGDTVNLCVRLQNENKRFKTRIILSEFTVQRLSSSVHELLELDRVKVRGREAPLRVYTMREKMATPLIVQQNGY